MAAAAQDESDRGTTRTPSSFGAVHWWFSEPSGRRGVRSLPPALWLLTVAWVGLLLAYSLLVPLFRAPDELQHVDLVLSAREHAGYGEYDRTFMDQRLAVAAEIVGRPVRLSTGLSADATSRHDRPTLEDIGRRSLGAQNQLTQHPPLYYASLGAASTVITTMIPGDRTWSVDRLVYLLRLLNVALLAAVPALAYAATRRLGGSPPIAITGALLVVAIPQLAHIGSTVNNDNLVILLGGVVAVGAAAIGTGDLSRRRALTVGVVLGLALLTKATSFVLCLAVALAYAAHLRHAGRLAAVRLAQCGAVAFVLGGWWWIKNLIAYGTVQPSDEFWLVPRHVDPVVGDWAERFFYLLPLRYWGQFGYLEASLNRTLVGVGTALILGGIVFAMIPSRGRWVRFVLVVPFLGSVVLTAQKSWSYYLEVGRPIPGIQGRYLFVGVVGVAAVVAAGAERLPGWARTRTPLLATVFALVMHLVAVHEIVRRFWGMPAEPWLDRLDDLRAFAPSPGPLTDLVLVFAAVSLGALIIVCAATALGRDDLTNELPERRAPT